MRRDAERAVDLEIQHHIAELADRLISAGWTAEAAQQEAERRFGDRGVYRGRMLRETRAAQRRMRLRDFVITLGTDVRHALRGLRRSPTFAATVIITVGVGIGAAAAVFTVLDALLLRPLPYRQPDRLVEVNLARESGGWLPILYAEQIQRWRVAAGPLGPLALFEQDSFIRTDGSEPESVGVLVVSHDLDETVGIDAYLGRTFTADDALPGLNRALLTHGYWRRLGADPHIVGTTIELEGRTYDVVGVLPAEFKFPVAGRSDLWIALGSDMSAAGKQLDRTAVVARLADNVSLEAAQARMDVLADAFTQEVPAKHRWHVKLQPVGAWRGNPDLVRGVWLLGGAVAVMLLVALANGANLLLFRAAERAQELEIRRALGGTRMALLRHILSEGVVLGLASGVFAVLLALAGVAALNGMLPEDFTFAAVYSLRIEQRVLIFTFLISLGAGIVLGLIPGLRTIGTTLHFGLLKARGATGRDRKLNQLLAGAEVALAMMLLMGAGLLANSLLHLTRVDPGFDADRTIVLGLGLPQTRYTTPEIRAAFFDRLEREIEAMPEVAEATVSNGVPPHTVFSFGLVLQAEGAEPITSESDPVYLPRIGTRPDYLATVGGRLLNGRDLTDADIGTDNVLIDDQLAAALWSDDAVGRRMRVDADGPWYTVVGVFQHMTMMGLDDRQAPYALIHPRNPSQASAYMFLGIRPTGDPRAALVPIRRVVHDMDPLLPIWILEAARSQLVDTIEQPRFLAKVMIALSFTALFLAAVGIYGVLSYAVTRRRREMGIRLALGARPDNVRQLFLRQGLLVTCLGIAVGLLTGMALTRLVRSLLFGVASSDPLTLGIAALVMASTAALASYLPARRATRVDPVEVLRTE